MKRIICLTTVLALALTMFAGCSNAPVPNEPDVTSASLDKDIVIIHTNDVHCAVEEELGYSNLAAYKAEAVAEGNYVTLVDAGDAIQGAPIGFFSDGSYIVDIMNEVGYDIAVPGNHEFDYGMDEFLQLTSEAEYKYTSCNFTDLTTNKTVFDPYIMKEYGGVKVAYVGICTPKTLSSSTPAYFMNDQGEYVYGFCQDETGAELIDSVQTTVDAARDAGAEYVVAVGHLGVDETAKPWMSSEIIAATTGIDAFIDGHSHTVLENEKVKNKDGETVVVASTGSGFESFGRLVIGKDGTITSTIVKEYAEKNAEIDTFIQEIQSQYQVKLDSVVASSEYALCINDPTTSERIIRNAETNLGDLCADAYRWATGADIAFANGGGIRAEIEAGEITYGEILNVQPYGNMIIMIEATGQEILDALELGVYTVPAEFGGFLQVSGLTYEIDMRVESSVTVDSEGLFVSIGDTRRVTNVMVGDTPIDPAATYKLAGHDYMIKFFGDGFNMFADNTILSDNVMLDYDALISFIAEELGGVVGSDYADPYGQERIVAIEK